eukprot:6938647-Prymnesium_polylepis.1
MNGSFNIRTRQLKVVAGEWDTVRGPRRYDVKGCRTTCTRGTDMRRAQALAAICLSPAWHSPHSSMLL